MSALAPVPLGGHREPVVEGNLGTWAVAKAAGVSYRRIDHWVRRGYIAPVGEPNPGSGADSAREFAPEMVARTVLLARIVRAGVLPGTASRVCDSLADTEPADLVIYGVRAARAPGFALVVLP